MRKITKRARVLALMGGLLAVGVATGQASNAGLVTLVGHGTWTGANDVSQSSDCAKPTSLTPGSSSTCTLTATSYLKVVNPVSGATTIQETCVAGAEVITSPIVFGTNPGCHITFTATIENFGAGGSADDCPAEQTCIDITAGSCSGYTLAGPSVTITDGFLGTYNVPVTVVQTTASLTMNGNYLSANIGGTNVVLINVHGVVKPGCVITRAGKLTFTGLFSGQYTMV